MGELSQDAGGMIREWLSELIKVLLAQSTGLFERCDIKEITYKIKESSIALPIGIKLFMFMGTIIGKALFERVPLNLCLTKTIYKFLTGEFPTLQDIQFLDESVIIHCKPLK